MRNVSRLFRDNTGPLSEQYQIITLNLRGYSRSETSNSEGPVMTYASDVLAVMDDVGVEQAIIGGISMHGPIVFKLYRQAPERFRGMKMHEHCRVCSESCRRCGEACRQLLTALSV